MTTPAEPRREHPSTYIVQDRSSEEELDRLRIQDQMVTAAMDGPLAEQLDPGSLHRVLDVGCGSGSWVIEAAQTYSALSVSGIDISQCMVEYARTQAVAQNLTDRVEFRSMDALRMLEFPTNFFDLVNLRFSVSWMRKWDWPKLLSELQRVTRPNGIVRITEPHIVYVSNSQALMKVNEIGQLALFRARHLFENKTTGITDHLVPLLTQHGVQQVQTKAYSLEGRAGTPQGQAIYEDMKRAFRTGRPFAQKWGQGVEEYDALCQQALKEMQQSDFHATWNFLTVWGTSPHKKERTTAMTDYH